MRLSNRDTCTQLHACIQYECTCGQLIEGDYFKQPGFAEGCAGLMWFLLGAGSTNEI